jgi:hypothetical protein
VAICSARIAPWEALLFCIAVVSQKSFQGHYWFAEMYIGLAPKQVNQFMKERNDGFYAALQTV